MADAIEKLNDIAELVGLNDAYDDPDIERALLKLVSILGNPEINTAKIARHVIECDALATLFALKAKYYMTIGKDDPDEKTAREKKNLYMTLREEFHALAASLKYMVRAQV
jgi:hypothetical protein